MKGATQLNAATRKAMATRATQRRLMKGPQSYRYRLNAVAFAGQRKGKVWERVS